MATVSLPVTAPPSSSVGGGANLATAQTGNGASTNIADRGRFNGAAIVRIVTTIGATPTCTYAIEVSPDGTTFFAADIADPATPGTPSVATFVITTATTVFKYVLVDFPWRFIRVTMSANTNVTSTIDVWSD
jgi:hypothetical protein